MASSTLVQLAPKNGKAAKRDRSPWYRSPKLLRHAVMIFFFLFLAHVAIDHQIKGDMRQK